MTYSAVLIFMFSFTSCDKIDELTEYDFKTTLTESFDVTVDAGENTFTDTMAVNMVNSDTQEYMDLLQDVYITSFTYRIINFNGDIEGTIHPLEFGLLYNNTDFYTNPSTGSSQYLSFTKDFAWLDSEETWTFLEFEASKYFSFGSSEHARQRVVALNLWTGSSPSWETSVDQNGDEFISHNPPFLEGAKLGGFYRFRAYPNNRFNDRSVLSVELRSSLK